METNHQFIIGFVILAGILSLLFFPNPETNFLLYIVTAAVYSYSSCICSYINIFSKKIQEEEIDGF